MSNLGCFSYQKIANFQINNQKTSKDAHDLGVGPTLGVCCKVFGDTSDIDVDKSEL